MFVRVFTAQVEPDKLDGITQLVQDQIIPAAKAQAGFQGLWFMIDAQRGKVMLVSHWANEADRASSESNGFLREQLTKLSAFVAAPPTTERFAIACRS